MKLGVAFFALALVLPIKTDAQQACQWYAANAVNELYPRGDAACRSYISAHGWPGRPPGFYAFHHADYYGTPVQGALCYFRIPSNPNPNAAPTNLYNAAVAGPADQCTDIGKCALYPESTTGGCLEATHRLTTTLPDASVPYRNFQEGWACGIRTACNARCSMDNCKWLELVSPRSTSPFLDRLNNWSDTIRECEESRSKDPNRADSCTVNFGVYNINKDLAEALKQYGCGTERDHNIVWQVNFAPNTCYVGMGAPERIATRAMISLMRNSVRRECIADRTARGLDPYINEDLRGKTCGS